MKKTVAKIINRILPLVSRLRFSSTMGLHENLSYFLRNSQIVTLFIVRWQCVPSCQLLGFLQMPPKIRITYLFGTATSLCHNTQSKQYSNEGGSISSGIDIRLSYVNLSDKLQWRIYLPYQIICILFHCRKSSAFTNSHKQGEPQFRSKETVCKSFKNCSEKKFYGYGCQAFPNVASSY